MAEFSEVMKQLARMANACKGKCDECPLDNSTLCNGPWCCGNTEGIAEAERIVMQWAAEHPEPVYPTWGEWFVSIGFLPDKWDGLTSAYTYVGCVPNLLHSPIPADIAEKLGIDPKEDT